MSNNDAIEMINLASRHKASGDLIEAIRCYKRACQLDPKNAVAWYNLGNIYKQVQQNDSAVVAYRNALDLRPQMTEAHFNLANTLITGKSAAIAINHYQAVIASWPKFAPAFSNLGNALEQVGRYEDALNAHENANALAPNNDHFLTNFGTTLAKAGKTEEANKVFQRAIALNPSNFRAMANLGLSLAANARYAEAVLVRERAYQLAPSEPEVAVAYAYSLSCMARNEDAIQVYRSALRMNPFIEVAVCNLLFLLAYSTAVDPIAYVEEAQRITGACWKTREESIEHQRQTAKRRDGTEGPLKIAYISGDFHDHAVMHFFKGIVANHSPNNVEVHAYSNGTKQDFVTDEIKKNVKTWTHTTGMSDDELCAHIQKQGIEVLIDLSGYNADNRMGAIAQRAAPIQVHYLGFFASTGVSAMDYWIGDRVLTPEDSDQHFSEKVWRLPRTWVSYQGDEAAPKPRESVNRRQHITFGSFNQIGKLTDQTLKLWANLLRALPNSQLLLKTRALSDSENRKKIIEKFAQLGVPNSRLDLRASTGEWSAHMATYDEIDIALDPIGGVGGGTTTCDALWMGVPVITLYGQSAAQRMTASMHDAIGHQEWVAKDEDEYIAKCLQLAKNVDERASLRRCLRNDVRNSPLCDAAGLAAALETAYISMHQLNSK